MFALTNVLHFFPDKFTRLGRRRFAFLCILASAFDCFFFWHSRVLSRLCFRLDAREFIVGLFSAGGGRNLKLVSNAESNPSPRIIHLSWGRMEVEGLGSGRDFKLYPGGGREWDWRETGTHHVPGIQPSDVEELLEQGSRVVVLSRGMQLALETCPETLRMLRENGVACHLEETKAAVDLYNQLAQTEPVGGLFHSTC